MGTSEDCVHPHPLFRSGIFLLPSTTGQEGFQAAYNPVTDSIISLDASDEVIYHESVHRIFSICSNGFSILRRLAGVSHSLLFALLLYTDTLHSQGRSVPRDGLVKTIEDKLVHVESLFEVIYLSILPAVEIAAIDFLPAQREHLCHTWDLQLIDSSEGNRKRKDQQIKGVAPWLSEQGNIYHDLYEDTAEELLATWEAYSSIKDPTVRKMVLKLAINTSSILPDPEDPGSFVPRVLDSLFIMRFLPWSTTMKDFIELYEREFDRIWSDLSEPVYDVVDLLKETLGYRSLYISEPYMVTLLLDYLLHYSGLSQNEAEYSELDLEFENTLSDPHCSLLTFRVDSGNRWIAEVNPGLQAVVERKRINDVPYFGQDWWRWLALFETLRGAVKHGGGPVTCPFLNWEGIKCTEECSIRGTFALIQAHPELGFENIRSCSLWTRQDSQLVYCFED